MKKVAIVQSNYIPWKGYFDLIAAVDEFILYDDVQFTKNDWRNRNRIKTPQGVQWLSVPVGQDINRQIREVRLPKTAWQEKHWATLRQNYRRAPCYEDVAGRLEPLYRDTQYELLSDLNRTLLEFVCAELGIKTRLRWSSDFVSKSGKSERLVDLCEQVGAGVYVSGPAAKDYLDTGMFLAKGIEVRWFDYGTYAEYPQLFGEFEHAVTILDLLFNCGPEAPRFMRFAGENARIYA